ncbi:hypothetical protein H6F43_21525 [Leptolyngbya sp. FACHB-36]|uniref:hypothetical protein n=1 Tax=Leptolyngbya sp. FACHB-36 TaxID=2692808 RepID=UPI00168040E7|nr:hypothetical protein [Leptolyngbya sp. FACHB-36]MBD2022767.1 hypothetical protein [Leptolyngbya sp. FACHB-36]
MTSTSSANQFLGRRRMEPAAFWLALLAGSVLIHLLLLLVTRSLLSQVRTANPAPIAVEFVQPIAASVQQGAPVSRTASSAPARTAPRSTAPTAPAASSYTNIPSSITPQTPPRQSAPPRPINPEPPPRRVPPPVAPPSRPPRPRNTPPVDTASGAPPFPNTPPDSPFPDGTNSDSTNPDGTNPDDRPLPPTTPPSGNMPPGGIDGSDNEPPSLPSVPVPSVPDQGSGAKLSVDGVARGNLTSTDVGPVPQLRSIPQLFDSVTYPAAVRANLGRPVTFQIVIDETGKPTQIDVVPEDTAPREYSNFVKELLQGSNLEFSPPTQDGRPVRLGAVRLTVRLEPLR